MSLSADIGRMGEDIVAEYLKQKGCEIVCRNYRIRGGEIDIVAQKEDRLFFVEVKTRKIGALTSGEQAITERKKKLLIRAAERFLSEYEKDVIGRFDVAVVDIQNEKLCGLRYYAGAFDASK